MTRASRPVVIVAAVVAATALAAPAAARGQDTVSAGVNVRVLSGTFGSNQTTHVVYAPAVVRIDFRKVELSANFPYLTLDSSTVALSQAGFVPMQGSLSGAPTAGMPMQGGGMMGQPGASGGTSVAALLASQSGFGDIVAGAGYRVLDDIQSRVQLVFGVRVKIPTAGSGLGTGRTDVAGLATIRKRFGTGWVYVEGGYLVVGKPAAADLRNVVLWSTGAGRRLTERLYLLASAAGSSAVVPAFGSPVEIGASLGVRLADRVNLTILPSRGLSNASAKYGLTVGISSDLLRR
jgi:hypothetical protein